MMLFIFRFPDIVVLIPRNPGIYVPLNMNSRYCCVHFQDPATVIRRETFQSLKSMLAVFVTVSWNPDIVVLNLWSPGIMVFIIRIPDIVVLNFRNPGIMLFIFRIPDIVLLDFKKPSTMVLFSGFWIL